MTKSRKLNFTKRRSVKKGGKPSQHYSMPVKVIASFDDEEEDEIINLPVNASGLTVQTNMSEEQKEFNDNVEMQIAKEEGIKNNGDNENIRTIRLARQGAPHFQFACGFFYYKGSWSGNISRDAPSNPVDYNKAFNWFQLAAYNFGEHEAQFYLGEMYELGLGTEENFKNALFWYDQSAQRGNEKAIKRLVDVGYISV